MRSVSLFQRAARAVLWLACTLGLGSGLASAQADKADSAAAASGGAEAEAVSYEQVRAVFKKHCLACHNDDRGRGGLDLSTLEGIKVGGASGAVVVSGKPDESLLFTLAAQLETPKMPPNKPKIPQRELDLIRHWIEGGPFGREDPTTPLQPTARKQPAKTVSAPAVSPALTPASARKAMGLPAGAAIEPLRRATAITALAVSPKSPLVAVSGHHQVVLFQWTEKMQSAEKPQSTALAYPEGDVFALRFSRDGTLLLAGGGVGGQSGKVVGFEVATGKRLFELGDETDAVLAVDISPDKGLVALGGPGRSVKVFRTGNGEQVATLRKHTDWILSLAFSPDGLLLASGDRFGGLQVWEAASEKEFHTLRGHVGPVNALAWTADCDRLLSAGQDGSLRYWDMHLGTLVTRWEGETGAILAVDRDAAGRVVCGGRAKKVVVWEKPEVQMQQMSMPDEVLKLGLSHDATHVIAGDAAGNIAVLSLATGALTGEVALPTGPPLARREPPTRTQKPLSPAQHTAPPKSADVAAAEEQARRAVAELAEAREAAALTDAAVKGTEASLKKLQESAVKLATVVAAREIAAKETARRAAELRAKAESAETAAAPPAVSRDQMHERLAEKRSLLESTRTVTERIERAARKSPGDAGLEAATKIANELTDKLAREVEAAVEELRGIEASAGTTQK